jgi:hypothetical protein
MSSLFTLLLVLLLLLVVVLLLPLLLALGLVLPLGPAMSTEQSPASSTHPVYEGVNLGTEDPRLNTS